MRRKNLQSVFLLLLFAVPVFVPAVHAEPGIATITYRHVFKGSSPEFIEIKISDQGKASYDIRQLDEDPNAVSFEVGPATLRRIFDLAGSLKHFATTDLDSRQKVAELGQKTFRYERDSEVHEATFNYTVNASANQLMGIFEGLALQQNDLVMLQQRMKYDRLGVSDALDQLESDLDQQTMPEPERLLPVLDQIAADSRFLELARTRARGLAERIRTSRSRE
jgi:hypothetical protein